MLEHNYPFVESDSVAKMRHCCAFFSQKKCLAQPTQRRGVELSKLVTRFPIPTGVTRGRGSQLRNGPPSSGATNILKKV